MNPFLVRAMRDYMDMCSDYSGMIFEQMVLLTSPSHHLVEGEVSEPTDILHESMIVSNSHHPVMDDLRSMLSDLRAHFESEGGDYGNGVEDGMARAADMLERILKRHEDQ